MMQALHTMLNAAFAVHHPQVQFYDTITHIPGVWMPYRYLGGGANVGFVESSD